MRNFFINEEGIISPKFILKNYKPVGSKLIFCFFHDVIDELLFEHKIDYFQTVYGENSYIIYKYVDEDIYLIHGIVGSPASAILLEELIALGVNKVIFVGGAGIVDPNFKRDDLILVTSAISEEGTSHHYFDYDEEISHQTNINKAFKNYLEENKIPFQEKKTWTIDTPYRETKTKVKEMCSKGVAIVEMEQAALIAVAKYRNCEYAALIYAGDDVSKDDYNENNKNLEWRNSEDVRRDMVDKSFEFLRKY